MKKLIISALLIVFGSVYAMAQDAQDTEMAMEAAPSVAISGSAKMGLLHDGALSTVGEYDVKFASSGVTDGGLTFGGSITIDSRDSNSITGDGFGVYVGSADGSWKLQFGDNDEGIATVGGFGVADPDDGVFRNTTTFVGGSVTVIPPVAEVLNDDGVDAMLAMGDLAGGTLELIYNDDGAPTFQAPDADLDEGVSQDVQAELIVADAVILNAEDTFTLAAADIERRIADDNSYYWVYTGDDDPRSTETTETEFDEELMVYRHSTWLTDIDEDDSITAAEKRFTFDVTMSRGYQAATAAVPPTVLTPASPASIVPIITTTTPNNRSIALSGTVASVSYALTAGTGDAQGWSFGTKYDAGVVAVGFGMNSNSVLSASVGGSVTNIGYDFIYVRKSGVLGNNWNALGLKVSSDLGGDSNVAVKYSKLSDKNGNAGGAMNATQIEIDFGFGLGGGASLFMEYDRVSETMGMMPDESSNTIQAGIKMSF
ncbi:MAG: hypothetical protein OXC02_08930 [Rhodobacteraceae bacterium]|nr:hypothetical protein [Paracoccaceae bacterium]